MIRRMGACVLLCAMLTGCRTPVVASYSASGGLGPNEHGLLVGTLEQRGAIDPAWLLGQVGQRRGFDQTDSEGMTRTVRTLRRTGSGFELRTMPRDPDDPPRLVWLELRDGSLRMTGVDSGGIVSRFEPGPVFVPAGLAAGERVEESFAVRSDGRGLRGQQGTGSVVLEGLGSQRIAAPAGVFDAFVLRWEMSLRVGAGTIHLRQTAWIDRTGGLIAEVARDRVTIFGIPVHRDERVGVLSEVEP